MLWGFFFPETCGRWDLEEVSFFGILKLVAGKNGELKRLGVTVELVRVLQRTGGMGF